MSHKAKLTPLERRFKLYRAMVQWRHLSDAAIMEKAVAALETQAAIAASPVPVAQPAPIPVKPLATQARDLMNVDEVVERFTSPAEQRLAAELMTQYVKDYNLERISEKNSIRDLIYLEVIQQRLQTRLTQADTDNLKIVPFDLLEALHSNADAITKLKNSLGLNKSHDKQGFDALQHLIKRHKTWRANNQASRYMKCEHCQKPNLLMMRTASWEARKHPFFQDNVIYNEKLFSCRNTTQLIDDTFISEVLGTSPDYVGWVVDHALRPATPPGVVAPGSQGPINTGASNGSSKETSGESQGQNQQAQISVSVPQPTVLTPSMENPIVSGYTDRT